MFNKNKKRKLQKFLVMDGTLEIIDCYISIEYKIIVTIFLSIGIIVIAIGLVIGLIYYLTKISS
jgi:hypothetical protein